MGGTRKKTRNHTSGGILTHFRTTGPKRSPSRFWTILSIRRVTTGLRMAVHKLNPGFRQSHLHILPAASEFIGQKVNLTKPNFRPRQSRPNVGSGIAVFVMIPPPMVPAIWCRSICRFRVDGGWSLSLNGYRSSPIFDRPRFVTTRPRTVGIWLPRGQM